jgi:RluA family pseudouridine synthase
MKMRYTNREPVRLLDVIKNIVGSSISARFIKKILEANFCRVNGRIERFASVRIKNGDEVELNDQWSSLQKKKIKCPILYEDEDLIVVNKPSGLVCSDEILSDTLCRRIWLAHRLDKDTTGVLLMGTSAFAAQQLQDCFRNRSIEKNYLAIVDGVMKSKEGVIKNYLVKKKAFQGQTIWGVSDHRGSWSETLWKCLGSGKEASFIECQPVTGRTHQIRVHMAHLGHPLLIDRQYAATIRSSLFAARPLLHAHQLNVVWKDRKYSFQASLPEDFTELLQKMNVCHVC